MKNINNRITGILPGIRKLALGISVMLSLCSCHYELPKPLTHIPANADRKKWLNFNVLFKSVSTAAERDTAMQIIIDSVVRLAGLHDSAFNQTDSVDVEDISCICDPLLHNVVATIPIGATGTLATTPTKPPGAKGAGDLVLFITENNPVSDSKYRNPVEIPESVPGNYIVDTSKILAVMDTGLDSALFVNNFHDLLWRDKPGNVTYRNFQSFSNGEGDDYYFDDNPIKHGSAVTSLALEAAKKFMMKTRKLTKAIFPQVMVLKVLDKDMNGSIFTISCALSYARQKKATVVNASLGYLDNKPDSVLLHYVNLCNTRNDSIPIVAAAGNVSATPTFPFCKTPDPANANKLTNNHKFYPGCLSLNCSNVICVTGLQNISEPCFYQYYSDEFVNMGVITNPSPSSSILCCVFPVRFLNKKAQGYEGSSFATPIVSGQLIAAMVLNHSLSWGPAYNFLGDPATASTTGSAATKKVLTYNSIP